MERIDLLQAKQFHPESEKSQKKKPKKKNKQTKRLEENMEAKV